MKISLLVLFAVIAVANAGVGILGPQEVEEAMRLFFQHCSGNSEGGAAGGTLIYCKKAREPQIVRDAQHELPLRSGPGAASQVVFVQPPDYLYRHNIQIKGGAGQPQQTRIYVLPPKINHEVKYDDTRSGGAAPAKPQLFFLNDQQNGGGGQHGGNGPVPFGPEGGFRSEQSQHQPQQLLPTNACNAPAGCGNNPNSHNNNNDNSNSGSGSPQVQVSATSLNPAAATANPQNYYRPVRQYIQSQPINPPLSFRG